MIKKNNTLELVKRLSQKKAIGVKWVYRSKRNLDGSISKYMVMTRRIQPLVSLNPYQGNWTTKVRVTSKGNMRSYKNARGEDVCSRSK